MTAKEEGERTVGVLTRAAAKRLLLEASTANENVAAQKLFGGRKSKRVRKVMAGKIRDMWFAV